MARLCSGFGTPSFPLSAMAEHSFASVYTRRCLNPILLRSHIQKMFVFIKNLLGLKVEALLLLLLSTD